MSLPSAEAFSRGEQQAMRLFYQNILSRLQDMEQTQGRIGFNTDSSAPINPPPPLAKMEVTAHPNQNLVVTIRNPQFVRSATPGKVFGNIPRTPMTHALEYTYDPTFATGIIAPPPGTQTHYVIPTNGKPVHFRMQSSVDGVNYNTPQTKSGHSK